MTRTPIRDLLRSATKVKRRSLVVKRLTTRAPGELLVALVSLGADRRAKPQATRLHTNGVTWQRVATRRARGGFVGIWRATPAARLHNATLTAKLTKSATAGTLTIAAYEPGTVVHASGSAAGSRSAPTIKLRAAPRAVALAVGSATKVARHRPASGTRIISQQRGGAAWLQTSRAAATSATIRIGDRSRLSSSWLMAGVVLAASDATAARATAAARRRTNAEVRQPTARSTRSLNARDAEERTYNYNAQGARIGITSTDEPAVTLGYDQANRLTSISGGTSYGYNGDGLRASKTAGGTTTQFAWDESGDLPLLLQAGSTSYVYGPDGEPIEQITGSTPTYLLGDQHGSTRLLTDSSGAVIGTYSYDAWGNRASHTGTATTELQYNGQYTDPESGLIYLRARYYDPTTGQFLTRDPLVATTLSPYGYANDDPVNSADPTGEKWIVLGSACVVGLYLTSSDFRDTVNQWASKGRDKVNQWASEGRDKVNQWASEGRDKVNQWASKGRDPSSCKPYFGVSGSGISPPSFYVVDVMNGAVCTGAETVRDLNALANRFTHWAGEPVRPENCESSLHGQKGLCLFAPTAQPGSVPPR